MNPPPAIRARAWRQVPGENPQALIECLQQHHELITRLAHLGAAVETPCPALECPRRRRYRRLILETVGVLEATRQSFKSKQLENLRKRLIEALAEGE